MGVLRFHSVKDWDVDLEAILPVGVSLMKREPCADDWRMEHVAVHHPLVPAGVFDCSPVITRLGEGRFAVEWNVEDD